MTRQVLFLRTALRAALSTLLLTISCFAQTPVVTWQLAESKLSLHEPVILRATVQNPSDATAVFNFGFNFTAGLIVRVTDPDGKPVGIPIIQANGFGRVGEARIEPRATYVRDFVVNNWATFTRPGRYLIGVTLKNPILLGKLSIAPPPESFQTLVIEEFDEAKLRRTCEALLSRITGPAIDVATVEDSLLAMEELSNIHHPIVVGYLVRSLNAPAELAGGRAIGPLAEFGTPEAISGLVEISRKPGPHAEEARRHLGQIQTISQDAVLRERLRVAKQAADAEPKQ